MIAHNTLDTAVNPGVYTLPTGSRVNDVLLLANPKENAFLDGINLAKILEDQDQIIIPDTSQSENLAAPAGVTSPFGGGVISASNNSSGKININMADAKSLEALPGIGPALSQRIVEYRQAQGPFKSIEELKKVSGIGDKKFEGLKDQVSIR